MYIVCDVYCTLYNVQISMILHASLIVHMGGVHAPNSCGYQIPHGIKSHGLWAPQSSEHDCCVAPVGSRTVLRPMGATHGLYGIELSLEILIGHFWLSTKNLNCPSGTSGCHLDACKGHVQEVDLYGPSMDLRRGSSLYETCKTQEVCSQACPIAVVDSWTSEKLGSHG